MGTWWMLACTVGLVAALSAWWTERKARRIADSELDRFSGIRDLEAHAREVEAQRASNQTVVEELTSRRTSLMEDVAFLDDTVMMVEHGLLPFDFGEEKSEVYKERIRSCRALQKQHIRDKAAAICTTDWQVGGSAKEGRRMVQRYLKLMLRAFNGECEAHIAKIKGSNLATQRERIHKSFAAINKLGEPMHCALTTSFLSLKIDEAELVYAHAVRRAEEKEQQREIREQMREEERVRREAEKARKAAESEQRRVARELAALQKAIAEARDDERSRFDQRLADLEAQLAEAEAAGQRAISQAQLTRAGHVYIISNLGSFGSDVFKIGMTRRLEPMDRVKELGDASVPFPFDVHAMIYTEDAPTLENALHKRFDTERVNLVNRRKEYFRVPLAQIRDAVLREHPDAAFEMTLAGEEHRQSQAMRAHAQHEHTSLDLDHLRASA